MRTDKKSSKTSSSGRLRHWLIAGGLGVGAAAAVVFAGANWVRSTGPGAARLPGVPKEVRSVERGVLASEGQLILAAKRAAENAGKKPQSLQELQGAGKLPADWTEGVDFTHVVRTKKVSAQVCVAINKSANLSMHKRVVVVVKDPAREQTADFGCMTADNTVFQKL